MAGAKYLHVDPTTGNSQEVVSNQSSAGAGDAGKMASLDATGRWDPSMMPVGIVAETASMVASEALSAGDFVNSFDGGGGLFKMRKADASVIGKEANGFVLAAVILGGTGLMYSVGPNTQVTALTPGPKFLSATTPGGSQSTPPSGSNQIIQRLGIATSATVLNFTYQPPLELA